MRRTGVVMAAALMASGCGQGEARKEHALDIAARRHHFEPPATMSRAEFGGMVERRFHQMDRDGDGYIEASEWPRSPKRFQIDDANGDGKLSADEYGHAALARFDARDTNHDGTVTQPEWLAARQKYYAAHPAGR